MLNSTSQMFSVARCAMRNLLQPELSAVGQRLLSSQVCVQPTNSTRGLDQLWQPSPTIRGVLIDAAGTLLVPSESAAAVYLRYASKYGCKLSEKELLTRYRRAYNSPWGLTTTRFVGDGRQFWRYVVAESTGCDSVELFEEIYDYYERAEAWNLAPGVAQSLSRLRAAGVKLAVVSNFDTRLKPLLSRLGISHLFDAIIVSADVGAEKPNPVIFEVALRHLNTHPDEVVHVGDDRRNDVWGARDAGIMAWLWGSDVYSFEQVADRVIHGQIPNSLWA